MSDSTTTPAAAPIIEVEVIDVTSPDIQPLALAVAKSAVDEKSGQSVLTAYVPHYRSLCQLAGKARDLLNAPTGNTAADAKLARALRLAIKGERCSAEKVRQQLKDRVLSFSRAVDGVFDVIEAEAKPLEAKLDEIEKTEARIEAARKAELRAARESALKPYGRDGGGLPLEAMSADAFNRLLEDARLAYEARLAAEQAAWKAEQEAKAKAEEERIAAEKAERERVERERAEAKARAEAEAKERARIEAENARLRAEKEAAEREAARVRAEEQAKAKAEAERLAAIAAEEKRVAEEARAAAEARAKAEREAREAIERAEAARLAAEAKRKAAEEEAARRAAAAPDAEKLRALADRIEAMLPISLLMETDGGKKALVRCADLLSGACRVVRNEADLLDGGAK